MIADCEISLLSRDLLTADMPSAAVSCVMGVFCSCMGDVWSLEVVARVWRSSFGVQLETMFVPARVEGLSYPAHFLVSSCYAAADDTEWGNASRTEGIIKQPIGVRFP